MNKLLIDYCKSRLTDSNYKPEYKEVTNAFLPSSLWMWQSVLMILESVICSLFERQTTNMSINRT
jgi:hypothetical protein